MAQLLSLGYFPVLTPGIEPCQSTFTYDRPYVSVTLQEAMQLFWIQKSLDVEIRYTAVNQLDDYCETKITTDYTATYGPNLYANGAFEYPEDQSIYLSYYTKEPIDETYLPFYSLARIVCPATGPEITTIETNGNEGCQGGGSTINKTFFMSIFHDPTAKENVNGAGGYLILNDKEVLINYGFNTIFSAFPRYTISTLVGQCEFLSEGGQPKYLLPVYGPDPLFVGNTTTFSMKIDWNTDKWQYNP
jgi:hypothetical protein